MSGFRGTPKKSSDTKNSSAVSAAREAGEGVVKGLGTTTKVPAPRNDNVGTSSTPANLTPVDWSPQAPSEQFGDTQSQQPGNQQLVGNAPLSNIQNNDNPLATNETRSSANRVITKKLSGGYKYTKSNKSKKGNKKTKRNKK